MKKTDVVIVGALLAVIAFGGTNGFKSSSVENVREWLINILEGGNAPSPPDSSEPTEEVKRLVKPVGDAIKAAGNPNGAKAFASLMSGLARVIDVDDRVTTTEQFARINELAGRILVSDGLKMSGVSDAAMKVFDDDIEPGQLDSTKRRRVVELLEGIAWAAREAL